MERYIKLYFDNYGFLHDKPSIYGEASSWNPLIYSALYRCVANVHIDYEDVFYYEMIYHKLNIRDITIMRHPDNIDPTSLDEIIGAIYLGLINSDFLSHHDWRWHDTLYTPKWWKVLKAAIYCLGEHRNFFKDQSVRDLHPIAYNTPPHIRYYALQKEEKFNLIYCIMFYLWLISVLSKKNYKKGIKQTGAISQKNIAWLVLIDLKSRFWVKLINHNKNLKDYFEFEDHPIIQALTK